MLENLASEGCSHPPVRDFFTQLRRAVRDSEYATFGGLETAHITATETPFPEKNWRRCSIEWRSRVNDVVHCPSGL